MSALQSWFKTRDQPLLLPVGPDNLLLSSGTTCVKSNQLHLQRDSRRPMTRNNPSAELSPTVPTNQTGQGRNHPSTKSTKTTLRKPARGKTVRQEPTKIKTTVCSPCSQTDSETCSDTLSGTSSSLCVLYHRNHTGYASSGKSG